MFHVAHTVLFYKLNIKLSNQHGAFILAACGILSKCRIVVVIITGQVLMWAKRTCTGHAYNIQLKTVLGDQENV